MNGGIILRIEHISKNFGAIRAVDDVSLDILDGEMHAIIGSNGAGKSTLMDLVCRRTIPSSGKVVFCDEDISVLPAHEIANRGMCKCFQISKLFGELKAFENVRIALVKRAGRTYDFLPKKKDFLKKEAIEVLRSVGLADKADETASLLSYGDQRRLEIAITLALEPRLLILDEPTAGVARAEGYEIMKMIRNLAQRKHMTVMLTVARGLMQNPTMILLDEITEGLAPIVVDQLAEIVSQLRKMNVSILVAEQSVKFALAVSDDCYILEKGNVVLHKPTAELTHEEILKYLGT